VPQVSGRRAIRAPFRKSIQQPPALHPRYVVRPARRRRRPPAINISFTLPLYCRNAVLKAAGFNSIGSP